MPSIAPSVSPVRVGTFYKGDLLGPEPPLDLLLTLDSGTNVGSLFEVDESARAVLLRETGRIKLVLSNASREIVRYTCV